MNLSLSNTDFKSYILKQLDNFFPDGFQIDNNEFNKMFDIAITRTEYCFQHVNVKTYCKDGVTYLNHLHSDQYAVFLWYLSNSVWINTQNDHLANKLFYLNKILHSFSCMYDTKMPNIFLLFHATGAVLGKGEYSDYFIATQGCTVGAQHGKYPRIGKGVSMLPYSSIIGECLIGNRVALGINTTIYQENLEDDTTVFKLDGKNSYKKNQRTWSQQFFKGNY